MFYSNSRFSLALILLFVIFTPVSSMEDYVSVSFNGTFVHHTATGDARANSPNGIFWCDYSVGRVGCAERELLDFRFYKNDRLLFTVAHAPGSDVYISNSGIVAFMDMTYHSKQEVTIHIYSKSGQHLFSKRFKGAHGFDFSSDGDRFGALAGDQLHVVTIPTGETEVYPGGYEFDFSEDGRFVAITSEESIRIYSNGNLLNQIETGLLLPRRVRISSDDNLVVVIDKRNINAYSLSDGHLIFTDTLTGPYSFRDLMLASGEVKTGIHYRHDGVSKGIVKTYKPDGTLITAREGESRTFKEFSDIEKTEQSSSVYKPVNLSPYDPVPWPFVPFDQMHEIWVSYEMHTWWPTWPQDSAYVHEGLDIKKPHYEPTYAVEPGFVKGIYTVSGDYHWLMFISPEWVSGWSDAWTYGHLAEETIQFDVGDTVQLHDYLGDLVPWTPTWSHIHFVEVCDSGLVWQSDGDIGVNFNPLRALVPDTDTIPPAIADVFTDSKFGFCLNETDIYLHPDSLYGDIDIIVKVADYIGDSEWKQPAFETFYWVKSLPGGDIVFPRTMGHRLNHRFNLSDGRAVPILVQLANVIYKWDSTLPLPNRDQQDRYFYQVVTNSDGDSLIDVSENQLAFNTEDYPDGEYRIFVEVTDEYGNSSVDSMDVQFIQGPELSLWVVPDDDRYSLGDTLCFTATIWNNTDSIVSFQGWTECVTAQGDTFSPLLGPADFSIGPGEEISLHVCKQMIPGNAPFGWHEYHIKLGAYPDDVIARDYFEFLLLAGRAEEPLGNKNDSWQMFERDEWWK
jgi:hypothetical protein